MIDHELKRGMKELLDVPLQNTKELIEKASKIMILIQLKQSKLSRIDYKDAFYYPITIFEKERKALKSPREFKTYFQ